MDGAIFYVLYFAFIRSSNKKVHLKFSHVFSWLFLYVKLLFLIINEIHSASIQWFIPFWRFHLPVARISAEVQLNSWKTLLTANETVSYDGRNFSVFCKNKTRTRKQKHEWEYHKFKINETIYEMKKYVFV